MTREWKTRRISVISRTTNGKNDRMALAATEKAKVWTSVRSRYFVVASNRPERRRKRGVRSERPSAPDPGFDAARIGGVDTSRLNPIRMRFLSRSRETVVLLTVTGLFLYLC